MIWSTGRQVIPGSRKRHVRRNEKWFLDSNLSRVWEKQRFCQNPCAKGVPHDAKTLNSGLPLPDQISSDSERRVAWEARHLRASLGLDGHEKVSFQASSLPFFSPKLSSFSPKTPIYSSSIISHPKTHWVGKTGVLCFPSKLEIYLIPIVVVVTSVYKQSWIYLVQSSRILDI